MLTELYCASDKLVSSCFCCFVFVILLCWRLSEKDSEFSVFSFFLCHKQ
jgi:hypothetical protein